jgi:hypothetical protein
MDKKRIATDLSTLSQQLPPIIARNKIDRYLGGLISRGYLENLDSQGKGPRRIRLGRRVGYLREDLIAWLQSRSRMEGHGGQHE